MRLMVLSEMLTELRQEAGLSADVSHGSHLQPKYISLLRRIQEEVYHAYDWPTLNFTATKTLDPTQRYAEYPTAFDFEGIRTIYQEDASGDWQPLGYGIGARELNDVDSDASQTRENIARWQNYLSPGAEQIHGHMMEVWPLSERTVRLRFEGKRKIMPLADLALHFSTVDGPIIILHAAAELLARQKGEDAALKLQKAQARFDSLKQRTANPDRTLIIPNGGRYSAPNSHRFRVR